MEGEYTWPFKAEGRFTVVGNECSYGPDGHFDLVRTWRNRLHSCRFSSPDHVNIWITIHHFLCTCIICDAWLWKFLNNFSNFLLDNVDTCFWMRWKLLEVETLILFTDTCFFCRSSSNIGEFSKDVRLLAALEEAESDGDKLLGAARRLAGAFSELLDAAQPGTDEVRLDLLWSIRLSLSCWLLITSVLLKSPHCVSIEEHLDRLYCIYDIFLKLSYDSEVVLIIY